MSDKLNMDMTKSKVGINVRRLAVFQLREINLLVILLALIIALTIFSPYFAKWANIKVVLGSLSIDGIVVIGMTIILISGGIDLSVGSMMCLSMTIIAKLFLSGINPWVAALMAVLICAAIGAFMGFLVTYVRLSHFIVSLCFMGIARGVVHTLTTGTPISLVRVLGEAPKFRYLGQGQIGGFLPMTVVLFAVIAILAEIVVRKSLLMRLVFYTGSNEKAAAYSGINVKRVKMLTCVVCCIFAALAGVIYVNKFSGVPVTAGAGLEMTAIASAVIGGVSMNGGKGSILGAILGLSLMALVQDALTLFNVPAFWQELIRYIIVLGAVVIDALRQNAALRRTE
ncbi:MAG: ABC transporter permease [Treponema sp.]|jgi:ribose transport system permease protein|nr:ABC transporter permease [Treponema sp.]